MNLLSTMQNSQSEMKDTPLKTLRNFQFFLLAAASLTFLLIVMGYIVRVSASANACPDWPICFGQWSLPAGLAARLQVIHRGLALLSTIMILTSAIIGWKYFRSLRSMNVPLYISSGLMGVQIFVGAFSTLSNSSAILDSIHLGLALASLGLLLTATVVVFYKSAYPEQTHHLSFQTPFNKLAFITLLA